MFVYRKWVVNDIVLTKLLHTYYSKWVFYILILKSRKVSVEIFITDDAIMSQVDYMYNVISPEFCKHNLLLKHRNVISRKFCKRNL